jgi:hypothetical protein
MTDLYLIAHKVRGEPAFDIAQHMTCPKCDLGDPFCSACDGAGHWWIIPTSGHRAFPIMNWPLKHLKEGDSPIAVIDEAGPLEHYVGWDSLRDHYTTEREIATDLIKVLGLIHKPLAPAAPIKRRF